jgi:DNA-binding MarR family transcriptional regulator
MPAGPAARTMPKQDAGVLARRVWAVLSALAYDDRRRRAVCDALGMSFGRVRALRRLAAGALTQRELAQALGTDKAYTTVIVGDLQERGLVRRTPHPVDRRAKLVTVTPAGAAAAQRAEALLGEPPAVLSTLDGTDLAALERILSRLA